MAGGEGTVFLGAMVRNCWYVKNTGWRDAFLEKKARRIVYEKVA
jgi:hypothetical protein